MKRLGYHSRKNEISGEMAAEVDRLIDHAAGLIELRAVCLRSGICLGREDEADTSGFVDIDEGGIRFESTKLNAFLQGTDQVLIMGITGGPGITAEIRELQLQKRMTEAVVIDAAASEIVDAGFDWIAALYTKELVREGRALTERRFSAGYGDFDIRFQQDIYRILELEKIGISLTESCMMVPEKSVTAIYGVNHGRNEK